MSSLGGLDSAQSFTLDKGIPPLKIVSLLTILLLLLSKVIDFPLAAIGLWLCVLYDNLRAYGEAVTIPTHMITLHLIGVAHESFWWFLQFPLCIKESSYPS
jgi:hypothetical protein